MELLIAGLALLVGACGGWIAAAQRAGRQRDALRDEVSQSKAELARLEAQSVERERAFAEQKRFLQDTKQQVQDTFARLSQEALVQNSKTLLEQTQERLAPLKEALGKLEARTQEMGKSTAQAYGSLEKHLDDLSKATATLRTSNEVLVTAFKGSMTARGRFGEIQLRNLVDTAGMLLHCDFIEQEAIERGLRPDMVINLPEGDGIPVDAKMPLSAYWAAAEATDPAVRKVALREHADLLRRQVRALSKRDYSQYVKGRIDYAVLFLPADPILSAAYEAAPDVFEEAVRLRVLIATPVTLIALMGTTKILWKQRALAENALQIQHEASELYKRVAIYQAHVERIGGALERATVAYNEAGGSYRSRVLPSARKIEELGGAAEAREKLSEMAEIEIMPHPAVRDVPRLERKPEGVDREPETAEQGTGATERETA